MCLRVRVLVCFFGFLMYVVCWSIFECGFVYNFSIGFYGDCGEGKVFVFLYLIFCFWNGIEYLGCMKFVCVDNIFWVWNLRIEVVIFVCVFF